MGWRRRKLRHRRCRLCRAGGGRGLGRRRGQGVGGGRRGLLLLLLLLLGRRGLGWLW